MVLAAMVLSPLTATAGEPYAIVLNQRGLEGTTSYMVCFTVEGAAGVQLTGGGEGTDFAKLHGYADPDDYITVTMEWYECYDPGNEVETKHLDIMMGNQMTNGDAERSDSEKRFYKAVTDYDNSKSKVVYIFRCADCRLADPKSDGKTLVVTGNALVQVGSTQSESQVQLTLTMDAAKAKAEGDSQGGGNDGGKTVTQDQKKLVGVLEQMFGWLKGDNEAYGKHTQEMETAVRQMIAAILATLLATGGIAATGGTGGAGAATGAAGGGNAGGNGGSGRRPNERMSIEGVKYQAYKRAKEVAQKREEKLQKLMFQTGATTKRELPEYMRQYHKKLEEDQKWYNDHANEISTVTSAVELAEKAADTAINILGECGGPATRNFKNAYTLLKAVVKNTAQVKSDGGSWEDYVQGVGKGLYQGGIGVLQNQQGDLGLSPMGRFALVVGGEAVKQYVDAYTSTDGDSPGGAVMRAVITKGIYFSIGEFGLGNLVSGNDNVSNGLTAATQELYGDWIGGPQIGNVIDHDVQYFNNELERIKETVKKTGELRIGRFRIGKKRN